MITSTKGVGNTKGVLLPTLVLVKGFQGEPVRMEPVTSGSQFVTLRRPGGADVTVRFSSGDVYSFDEASYGRLVKAFTSGDRETLDRLWRDIPPIR